MRMPYATCTRLPWNPRSFVFSQGGGPVYLDMRQSRRFLRLFGSLEDYATRQLFGPSVFGATKHLGDGELMHVVYSSIWGDYIEPSIIDRYCDEIPDGFDRGDLEPIRAFRQGIHAVFTVTTYEDDTLLLFGNYAFNVCGQTSEAASRLSTVPILVETALVPFEGVLTVATTMAELLYYVSDEAVNQDVQDAIEGGRLVSTAHEFELAAPLAREIEREREAAGTEADGVPSVEELGWHRGALAGLAWEEREALLSAKTGRQGVIQQRRRPRPYRWYGKTYAHSAPQTLAEALSPLKKNELVDFARRHFILGIRSSAPKDDIVALIAASLTPTADAIISDTIRHGIRELQELRLVFEAQRDPEVARANDRALRKLVPSNLPYIVVVREGSSSYPFMLPEIRSALEGVDWDEQEERARRIDATIDTLCTLADYRGAVRYDEVEATIRGALGPRDRELALSALEFQCEDQQVPCHKAFVPGDNTPYLVDDVVARSCGIDRRHTLENVTYVMRLLQTRGQARPRQATDIADWKSILDQVRASTSYHALVAYLDEHVPDTADDYKYAEDVAGDFVQTVQRSLDGAHVDNFIEGLRRDYGIASQQQLRDIRGLACELARDVPMWANNGWSENELKAMN